MPQSGIMDLKKWAEKTAQAVKRICSKKQAPCVGFCLVFFDPTTTEDNKRWNYVIELAFDPNNPPSEQERQKVEEVLEFIGTGIRKMMDADLETGTQH